MPATWAAVGVVSGLAQGVFGGISASKANADAAAYQKKMERRMKKQAKITNEYNKQQFEAQKENYYKQAQYNFDTAIKSWEYQTAVRALEEKVDAQKYMMNLENSQKQLTFNEISAQQAQNSEQLAINDALSEYRFQGQDQLINQLQAEGQAQLGQAGKTFGKRLGSEQAKIGQALAVMSASLTGEIQASNLRMFDISLGKYAADARVEAARMLRPEKLPDIPAPTMPPEPVWVAPAKVLPGMAAPAATQSVWAPIIGGIAGAATAAAKIDWNTAATAAKNFDPFGQAIQGIRQYGQVS